METSAPAARRGVVGFAVSLAVITYIDRICIMKAAPYIQRDLGLSGVQMGWVFTAFVWAYGIFEVPWGWLGDRIGPRKVLLRIVVAWSVFTAATGWTWNFGSLVVTRALFGAGEAGCFPNLTKAFAVGLPPGERVRAQGILWLSARWGGALTPLLVLQVLAFMSWRRSFELFGAIGIVWALVFWKGFRAEPAPAPASRAEEAAPWRRLLSSPRLWLLSAQYFLMNYGAYLYVTWLPSYWKEERGVEGTLAAVLDGTPLFFMGVGSLASGLLLARPSADPDRRRRRLAILGYLASFAFILISLAATHPLAAALLLGLAGFSSDLAMPASWGACMAIGGRYAGTVSAFMNTLGCLGAGLFPVAAQALLEASGRNWSLVLGVNALAYLAAAACWCVLDSETPLFPESKEVTA
jgi:ACS family glucarate transporter-like MFS transporter